jgi:hypothetical protein
MVASSVPTCSMKQRPGRMQYLHGRLPFGGANSGIGNTHGHFGFRTFSHARAVVRTRTAPPVDRHRVETCCAP